MPKRFLIIMGVLASFLWCSLAFGENVPKEKKPAAPQVTESKIDYSKIEWRTHEQMEALRVKELPGPAVMSTGVFRAYPSSPDSIIIGSPFYDTAGFTTYDLAGNDRISRQIALSGLGYASMDWTEVKDTANIGATSTLREVYYSAWFNTGVRTAHDHKVSGGDDNRRSGFCGAAVTNDGRAVLVYHHVLTVGLQKPGTYIAVEGTPSVGDFPGELKASDSSGATCDHGIWPSVAAHNTSSPDSAIIHIVSVEGTGACGASDFYYCRAREVSSGVFSFAPAVTVDSSNDISITAIASHKSGKVALIWDKQKSFTGPGANTDIYYVMSTNYGREWVNGFGNDVTDVPINITNYQAGDPVRASGVLSGVFDQDDSLHIVWVAPLYNSGSIASECYIYHWSKATGIDQVADGTFNMPDAKLHTRPSSFNLMDPFIGVHDGTANLGRKNYLYVTFTQFGPGTSDASTAGIVNGEIYINASTNGGNTWAAPINITNSSTPGCTNNCDDDVNATSAERVNDTIHISYLNDKSTGYILQGQGSPTLNPVLYYKYPAYTPAAVRAVAASPPAFEDPVASPTLANLIDTSFKVSNVGNQTVRIDSVKKAGVSAWLTFGPHTYPDSILEGGAPISVNVKFNGTGLATSTYVDTIVVFNNSANKPRMTIPVHLVVTSCGYFRRTQVVAQVGDLKVKFGNTGNIVDQDLTDGFYLSSVNKNLMYDGTSVMATTITGPDTLTLMNINGKTYVHTLSSIDTQTVTFPDSVTFAQAKSQQRPAKEGTYLKIGPIYVAMFYPDVSPSILWPGPWFKYWMCQTWYIKVSAKPRNILWFNKIYKGAPPCWWPLFGNNLLTGKIYAGGAMDIDLPSDTGGVINTWGSNDTLKYVYQQGDGPNGSKILFATAAMVDTSVHIGNPNGFYSAKVHRNADFFPDDPKLIYRVISDSGFVDNLTPIDTSAIIPSDRHTQFAAVCFDTLSDTVTYVMALVLTDMGPALDSLKENVKSARLDMKLPNPGISCTDFAGDANGSGTLTLPDIIVLVNHVFKGGPQPNPKCRGDCNNTDTITLPDIIILVNYIFKGGAKPAKDTDGPCCK